MSVRDEIMCPVCRHVIPDHPDFYQGIPMDDINGVRCVTLICIACAEAGHWSIPGEHPPL